MALPKQSTPVYELVIPSTGKKVSYRPFLVKDQKALLIANESKDPSVMIATLKEVIKDCIIQSIDVDSLALFDIEYIFCKLRAKSVGEVIDITLKCPKCSANNPGSIDISEIDIVRQPNHSKKFILFDNVGVSMKYPTYNLVEKLRSHADDNINDMDAIIEIIVQCIEYIYDRSEIYYAHETEQEDLVEFVNNLTRSQLEKITEFFDTMPKVSKDLSFKCIKCAEFNEMQLEGIKSFF